MISIGDFMAKIRQPLTEGWGYIWGKYGQVWTEAEQKRSTRDMTVRYGKKWIGKRVCDCSGLIRYAYTQNGLEINHSSQAQWESHCSRKGKLENGFRTDGEKLKIGTAMFQETVGKPGHMHHVGVYAGSGRVIEAMGTINGVTHSNTGDGWTHWGELKQVDYTGWEGLEENTVETVKKGSKGISVMQLQEDLSILGYSGLLIDGVAGTDTVQAIKAFQRDHGLEADGIAGVLTWAAIEDALKVRKGEPAETEQDALDRALQALDEAREAILLAMGKAGR